MKKLTALFLCACIAASAAFAQTRQQAKDEIARLEKMPAQIDEMLGNEPRINNGGSWKKGH